MSDKLKIAYRSREHFNVIYYKFNFSTECLSEKLSDELRMEVFIQYPTKSYVL